MFEDFDRTKTVDASGATRFAMAGVLAAGFFGSSLTALAIFARQHPPAVEEPAVVVEFAEPPPQPEEQVQEEEEQVEETRSADARPLMAREVMQAPTEIPDEALRESAADLAPVAEAGPVDGFLTGTPGGGRGGIVRPHDEDDEPDTPHVIEREDELVRAAQTGGCRTPSYPAEARASGIQGHCTVRIAIGEDGQAVVRSLTCDNPIFEQAARECAANQTWRPAHLGDGTVVPDTKTIPWRFVLSNVGN